MHPQDTTHGILHGGQWLHIPRGNDVLSGHAVGVGSDRDRRAVHVGAADHQHLVADHALMAGEDISRQIGAGKMAEMA